MQKKLREGEVESGRVGRRGEKVGWNSFCAVRVLTLECGLVRLERGQMGDTKKDEVRSCSVTFEGGSPG